MNSRSESGRVTASEFAESYGISPSTVRKWNERGKVHPVGKRGTADLFNASDLLAVFQRSKEFDRRHAPRDELGRFRPGDS